MAQNPLRPLSASGRCASGARGLRITQALALRETVARALFVTGPVIGDVVVDSGRVRRCARRARLSLQVRDRKLCELINV